MKVSVLLGASALFSTLAVAPVSAQVTNQSPAMKSQTTNNAEIDRADDKTQAPAGSLTSQAAADNTSAPGGEDLIITGTRIPVRNTIDAVVPIVSISAAQLLGTRGDVSLGDALNQLPQLRSTFSQANSTGSIGTAGLNILDLRGLGTARTLTLLNGRRIVTAVPGAYTPDVNTVPFDLVERTEVVTGGNSAIYGSDAIAGVVNIITRKDFSGTRLRVQGGASTYGDRGSYLVSGITGANFLDGRVNLTVTSEYSHAEALFYRDRDYLGAFDGNPGFITSQITTAPNRNFDGIPNTNFVERGIKFGTRSLGGTVITTCPTATAANAARVAAVCTGQTTPTGGLLAYNYVFQPDGSLLKDSPATTGLTDNRAIGGGFLRGATATGTEDSMLVPGVDRWVSNINLNGNFSDAFKPFVELTYARIKVFQQSSQPTFNGGTLTSTFSLSNPFLTPATRSTLSTILAPGATTFISQRFNDDFGTRSEFHTRETFRAVAGVGGDLTSSIRYEVAGNYGRTDNFYRTGGNVLLANYANAVNAAVAPASFTGSNFVLNSQGQRVVCAVNANASTADDIPGCYPLNLFGNGAPDPRALQYILYTSNRTQWAEEIDATAFIAGDTSGFFSLPGGPVGFSIGGEYRREDAQSRQDPITNQTPALTFLNPASTFDPPAVNIKEAFGELRVPILANFFAVKELTAEGAVRVSDYGGNTGSVWAWNAGGIYAPINDLRFRVGYSKSVRAPNLSNLYATAAVTYANGLTDPCDQPGGTNATNNINSNPNRARNCAAAGIPTTIVDPATGRTLPWTNVSTSGIAGSNQGNPNLQPETGYSFTLGGSYTPHQVRGLSLSVDYYNIRVRNVISGLTGQTIINRCYDDPVSIDNVFCAAVFRRDTADAVTNKTFNGQTGRTIDTQPYNFALAGNGLGFINQPFNFAALITRGIDGTVSYVHRFNEDLTVNGRLSVSYVKDRIQYSTITDPTRYDRIDQTLGDPRWQGLFNIGAHYKVLDVAYKVRYVGKQIVSGLSYDTFFSVQGRAPLNPDARPFVFYNAKYYQDFRVGIDANEKFRFYFGVDNVTNELPPYELTGTGSDAIYPNTGRFFYAGAEARF